LRRLMSARIECSRGPKLTIASSTEVLREIE
jgi:hypothetical protein